LRGGVDVTAAEGTAAQGRGGRQETAVATSQPQRAVAPIDAGRERLDRIVRRYT
jgi:hypothetical protein